MVVNGGSTVVVVCGASVDVVGTGVVGSIRVVTVSGGVVCATVGKAVEEEGSVVGSTVSKKKMSWFITLHCL